MRVRTAPAAQSLNVTDAEVGLPHARARIAPRGGSRWRRGVCRCSSRCGCCWCRRGRRGCGGGWRGCGRWRCGGLGRRWRRRRRGDFAIWISESTAGVVVSHSVQSGSNLIAAVFRGFQPSSKALNRSCHVGRVVSVERPPELCDSVRKCCRERAASSGAWGVASVAGQHAFDTQRSRALDRSSVHCWTNP